MYLSPQAITYLASEDKNLVNYWHKGLSLDLRVLSKNLNASELLFLQAGNGILLENPSSTYQDVLHEHPIAWVNYLHNTGKRFYQQHADHQTFANKHAQPWLTRSDNLTQQEITRTNPYNNKNFSKRARFNRQALKQAQYQAKKLFEITVPGISEDLMRPVKKAYRKPPKNTDKKMWWQAHQISEHYKQQAYPRPDYQGFMKAYIQWVDEKAHLANKQAKNPLGVQTRLDFHIQETINKNPYQPPTQEKHALPRGDHFEQQELFK